MTFIHLLTDFGLKDQYVFQMKAVIKQISPRSQVLDITHDISKFSIKEAAFILAQSEKYFPPNSIAVAVVDPGVGSNRTCIAIRTRHYIFVGPDNGVLYEAACVDGFIEARAITSKKIILKAGGTFDGRDVFAPASAHLAEGFPFMMIGKRLQSIKKYSLPIPTVGREELSLNVVYIDHYGNIILGIQSDDFLRWAKGEIEFRVSVGSSSLLVPMVSSYSELSGPGLLAGSSGLLELSTNMNGQAVKKVRPGYALRITRVK